MGGSPVPPPRSEGGCWPPRAACRDVAGRMSGGGGWLSESLGCRKRPCCRGGGWRCNVGAVGSVGLSKGGGWERAAGGGRGEAGRGGGGGGGGGCCEEDERETAVI